MPLNPRVASSLLSSVYWIFQAFAGALLLWSATEHLSNNQYFLVSVLRYNIVSGWIAEFLASVLPVFQLVLGVFLIGGLNPKMATGVAFIVFAFFAGVQFSAWARDLPISCGCFGPQSSEEISLITIGKVALLSVVMLGIFFAESCTGHKHGVEKT